MISDKYSNKEFNLIKTKENLKLWMMIELSKMKTRDISSGLLKKNNS